MSNNKKVLGIIGGMGPAATALLFQKIIDYTDALTDAEHIQLFIDNNTGIPDRTAAILEGSLKPAECICESGRKLVECGAELLLIPCNTSHYFYSYIQEHLPVPVINMIEETARECSKNGYRKVGVLATTGTCKTKIYHKALEKYGIEAVFPEEDEQLQVMHLIYDQVKAGKEINHSVIEPCLTRMKKEGVQVFILGCTELPVVLKNGIYGCQFIDSLDVLARCAVKLAGYRLKDR